jgi:hypothetical protein
VWVTTGAEVPPPPPEPALEPLVWVTTGAVWVGAVCAPPPDPEWEPLVWVTTGAGAADDPVCPPAVLVEGAVPPLVWVTTGDDSVLEGGAGAVADEPLAEVVTGAAEVG